MTSRVDRFFSPEDRERIRAAVVSAEQDSSGEIVPYVVGASDRYEGAPWKAATLGSLLFAIAAGLAHRVLGDWLDPAWGGSLMPWALPPLAGAASGLLAARLLPGLRRLLVGSEVLERRVRRRAAVAFLEEEVFRTRDRTGILVFLSLFERRVVVLADEGINRRVRPEEWQAIVDGVVTGIRTRRAGEALGLAAAINDCGRLLAQRGVGLEPEEENELADQMRSRER